MSEWWNVNPTIPFENKNFQTILNFYLFQCPVEFKRGKKESTTYQKVSQRARSLRERGWIESYATTLVNYMKESLGKNSNYDTCKSEESVAVKVKQLENSGSLSDKHFEVIVYTERSEMNKANAILYYIRNAFAHASFSVTTVGSRKVYYFESAKNGVVKARIRLNETTLLNWMEIIITLHPKAARDVLNENKKQQKNKKKRLPSAG